MHFRSLFILISSLIFLSVKAANAAPLPSLPTGWNFPSLPSSNIPNLPPEVQAMSSQMLDSIQPTDQVRVFSVTVKKTPSPELQDLKADLLLTKKAVCGFLENISLSATSSYTGTDSSLGITVSPLLNVNINEYQTAFNTSITEHCSVKNVDLGSLISLTPTQIRGGKVTYWAIFVSPAPKAYARGISEVLAIPDMIDENLNEHPKFVSFDKNHDKSEFIKIFPEKDFDWLLKGVELSKKSSDSSAMCENTSMAMADELKYRIFHAAQLVPGYLPLQKILDKISIEANISDTEAKLAFQEAFDVSKAHGQNVSEVNFDICGKVVEFYPLWLGEFAIRLQEKSSE